ncbi:MAG: hypothetical protein M1822_000823 [Bathelium mastoideum]|nr:MAG: hypothetical protein M1822_000823 [Bathelium mastoideum]
MANILHPWLHAMIEEELEAAIQWKTSDGRLEKGDDNERPGRRYEEDGGNIHIQLGGSRTGKSFVQLIEARLFEKIMWQTRHQLMTWYQFISVENPITAFVSDGTNVCYATFSTECAATFKKQHERSLTGTRGSFFRINEVNINLNFSTDPRHQIALEVHNVKWVKSRVGESTYGRPDLVLSEEPVVRLMSTLVSLNERQLHSLQCEQLPKSPLQSQAHSSKGLAQMEQTVQDNDPEPRAKVNEKLSDKALTPYDCLGDYQSENGDQAKSRSSHWWADVEIRRSFVKVPADQQALLDRPDSWYPSQPGSRFPTANLPLHLLEELHAAAEKRTRHDLQKSQARNDETSSQGSVTASDAEVESNTGSEPSSEIEQPESDPDKPFASAIWPRSPLSDVSDALPSESSPPLPSVELPAQSTNSPSKRRISPQQQVSVDLYDSQSENSPTRHPKSPVTDEQTRSAHSRSSSENSDIAFTPLQAVMETPLQGIQMLDKSTSKSNQHSSPKASAPKYGATMIKRPGESLPHDSAVKRFKAQQSTENGSSSSAAIPDPFEYKWKRKNFLASLEKSSPQNNVTSSVRAATRSTQASPIPTRVSTSPQASHNFRSDPDGDHYMNSDVSPQPASVGFDVQSAITSSVDHPQPLRARNTQLEDPNQPHKLGHSTRPRQSYSSRSATSSKQTQEVEDIYEQFTRAYGEYTGDRKHFHNLCKKLDSLQSERKAQHRSLWDDYIIRHKTDYVPYLARAAAEGEDPMTYEDFYRDEVDEPLTRERILGPVTLKVAMEQLTRIKSDKSTPLQSESGKARSASGHSSPFPLTRNKPEKSTRDSEEQRNITMIGSNRNVSEVTRKHHQSVDTDTSSEAQKEAEAKERANLHNEEELDTNGEDCEMWKDRNAPFKEYARAYAGLKSLNGRFGIIGANDGIVRPHPKRIDTLSWRL